MSLGEIAENEGITRQGVRDLIKRAEQQLIRFEEECGWSQKFSELRIAAEKLDKDAHSEIIDIIEKL